MKRTIILFCLSLSVTFLFAQMQVSKTDSITSMPRIDLRIDHSISTYVSVLPNQYMQSLGYFCKKEIQLQKQATFIPVKLRLGTQQSCDHIEGK